MTTRNAALCRALSAAALVLVCAAPARGQQTVTEIVGFLVTNLRVDTSDAARDRQAAEAARDAITRALLVNLTSVPIATSSSGFLYRLNPELGTVERATESFGGFFVERALAAGRGRVSFGVSGETNAFDRLDGASLRDGTLVTTANEFTDEADAFDTEFLTLRVRSSTMTVFGTIGVTDRLEIGGAVPFVRLTLEGERVELYRGERLPQAQATATASGVADAALRAKYNVYAARGAGLALAGELRLPTGDADNLLGAGSASARVMGIAAIERGAVTLSGNAGLVRGGVSDEFTYSGSISVAVRPRLTFAGEVLARHISQLRPLILSAAPHPSIDKVETLRLVGGEAGQTVAGGIAGIKWNATGTIVIAGHVRWSFTSVGLTAPLTPSLGLEYSF